jgi:hypothetical protein
MDADAAPLLYKHADEHAAPTKYKNCVQSTFVWFRNDPAQTSLLLRATNA